MSQDFKEMIVQYLTGSVSESEAQAVEQWLDESPDNRKYFSELQNLHLLTRIHRNPSGFDKDAGWARIRAAYFEQQYNNDIRKGRIRMKRMYWWVAASIVAFFSLGYMLNQMLLLKDHKPVMVREAAYNEVTAPIGSRVSLVLLSDGTQVWLNAGSKLRYPALFNEGERQVYLEGEAFFDVSKGRELFVVKTSDLEIKVYGTRFNVKSYPEEDLIQTTLVEGSLSVEPLKGRNSRETVMIEPNQQVTFFKSDRSIPSARKDQAQTNEPDEQAYETIDVKSGEILVTPEIDPQPITSWKDEEWVFSREPLDQLATKLERRFNVDISFEDEALKNYVFTGSFRDETFEQILDILELGAPVTCEIDKNHVKLKEDPSYKSKYDTFITDPTN